MKENIQDQSKDSSQPDMVFIDIDKEPCENCKNKEEIKLELPLWKKEEWDYIIPLLDKYKISPQDMDLIYNFSNRIFKENKRPGCGKCFVNLARRLKIKHQQLFGQ